ncbi:MAG: D-inositol-3-phosphate glycosyltransferase, partial [Jiangellaceae bacterium]|nr:D-inositol-3-phosphate glycosyltransferase [Jiangellaceae bacterium]
IVELARRLAARGVVVDIFSRASSAELPEAVHLAPGVTVQQVRTGPHALDRHRMGCELRHFTEGVLRTGTSRYDVVHSHYWLAGLAGEQLARRWDVPLVHSMHTMAKVKNLHRPQDDAAEPVARIVGELQVVDAADRLVASTGTEANQLVALYGADPERVVVVSPGVDLDLFTPGDRTAARHRLGLRPDAVVLLFAGRIQPLKAPDLLLRAAALLVENDRTLRDRLVVAVVGGPSGSALARPEALRWLAKDLEIGDITRFEPPVEQRVLVDWYRAADLTVVPSYSESFWLVALESEASGTPVLAASAGGLPTAVANGYSGLLVASHDPVHWAMTARGLLDDPALLQRLRDGALSHARTFSWRATADRMLSVYARAVETHRMDRVREVVGA